MRFRFRLQPSTRRPVVAVLAVACLLVTGAACAGGGQPSGIATGTSAGAPAVSTLPPASGQSTAVPATLAFSAPVVGGGQFDGASLAGKPAVLWFWAALVPALPGQGRRCQDDSGRVRGQGHRRGRGRTGKR